MKQIESCSLMAKYQSSAYELISDDIFLHKGRYVTCLSFQQEPDYGEGENAGDISQYPLEDILDHYSVYVSDFFKEYNKASSLTCYLEFTGFSLEDVLSLRSIIGKHVYNRAVKASGQTGVELVIE